MNEVSCKVFGFFTKPLKKKGVPLEDIVKGTQITVARFLDKKERIDWTDFILVMRNLHNHFTYDEYVELGRSYLRAPALRFAFVIARLILSPMGFYRWFNKPREGVGNQMFTCIVPSQRELSPTEIEVDLTLPEGFEVCWDFYVITIGNFTELPRLLGLPASKVTLTSIPRGGRFHVVIPSGTPLFTRVWRFVMWPFTARAAARELKDAHETLVSRVEEIEAARLKLDRQATQLRTGHTVNTLVQGDLDLSRTLDSIAKALVDEAGFASAEIQLSATDVPGGLAKFGATSTAEPLRRAITSRGGQTIGEVTVTPRPEADRVEREELLEFIVPTLAMAIQNALDYRSLEDYRTNLEKLVDERTRELREARDQLAGSVEQLREAKGVRERFFANISHEIRTPLSLIMLAAGDIETRAGALLDDRARGSLGSVTDAARKLVRLVDELLLLAAGQEDKFQIHPEPTDLGVMIAHLVAAWRPAAEAAGLELASHAPASVLASVDPVAIERVATNLVSNAVKYTPRGGRIDIELVEQPDGLRLSVLDTGRGIGDELASRLFGRFERARGEDRQKAGSGIGLSLVKQLVEAHGGTVNAFARAGGPGAELRVVLPSSVILRESATRSTELRLQAPTVTANQITSGTKFSPPGISAGTIVLAEDDARLAEMIARLLAEHYTVIVGLDGAAALELVRKHQPQLLVTDVDMPEMNGIELSRKFRELTGDRLAPIIILSAVIDLGTRLAGLEAGAIDYVTKPFDPLELVARVRAQFRMRDLAVRLHRAEQLASLGILTSGLAHEIRNPANGIVNAVGPMIQMLPADVAGPDTGVGQLLDVMKSCAEQIASALAPTTQLPHRRRRPGAPAGATSRARQARHVVGEVRTEGGGAADRRRARPSGDVCTSSVATGADEPDRQRGTSSRRWRLGSRGGQDRTKSNHDRDHR